MSPEELHDQAGMREGYWRHLKSLGFGESRLCAMAKQLLKFRTLDLGKELKGTEISDVGTVGDYFLCCHLCPGEESLSLIPQP